MPKSHGPTKSHAVLQKWKRKTFQKCKKKIVPQNGKKPHHKFKNQPKKKKKAIKAPKCKKSLLKTTRNAHQKNKNKAWQKQTMVIPVYLY